VIHGMQSDEWECGDDCLALICVSVRYILGYKGIFIYSNQPKQLNVFSCRQTHRNTMYKVPKESHQRFGSAGVSCALFVL
jgi:hypothetical protein